VDVTPLPRARLTSASLATIAVTGLLLAACTTSDHDQAAAAQPAPWAETALERFAAELDASRTGVAEYVQHFAEDVVVDGLWQLPAGGGRQVLRDRLALSYGPTFDELHHHHAFVDAEGALLQLRLPFLLGFDGSVEVLEHRDYRPDGVARVHVSLAHGDLRGHSGLIDQTGSRRLDTLAASYLAGWSAGDPTAIAELYDHEARIVDTVLGLDLRGRAAITAHLASVGELATLREATIPGSLHRARYLDARVPAAVRTLSLLVHAEDGDDCPGRMAVLLTLADGRIVAERRLHDVADARRCVAQLPDGWWNRLRAVPPPDAVTGHLRVGEREIELRGATPTLEGLVTWALDRFDTAGLPPPPVSSITFASATGRCDGLSGAVNSVDHEAGTELLLCFDEARVCVGPSCQSYSLAARTTILHELAHVWLAASLDDRERAAYLERTGLEVWFAGDVPWAERGGERAAEVVMGGLLERAVPLIRIGEPPCGQLIEEFRALTGVDTLWSRCPPRATVQHR
jgi:hypothetical protein